MPCLGFKIADGELKLIAGSEMRSPNSNLHLVVLTNEGIKVTPRTTVLQSRRPKLMPWTVQRLTVLSGLATELCARDGNGSVKRGRNMRDKSKEYHWTYLRCPRIAPTGPGPPRVGIRFFQLKRVVGTRDAKTAVILAISQTDIDLESR